MSGIFKKLKQNEKNVSITIETEETDIFVEIMKSGEEITLFCMNYFYTGKIEAVNGEDIVLTGARIVYETGDFNDSSFKDAQKICANQWFIRKSMIESYGVLNKA